MSNGIFIDAQTPCGSIDNFITIQNAATNTLTNDYSTITGTNILGGERDIAITNKIGTVPYEFSADAGINVLDITHGGGENSKLTVQWDGVDGNASTLNPIGLGGINLTGTTKITIPILKDTGVTGRQLPITLELWTNAGKASSLTITVGNSIASTNVDFLLSSFTSLVGTGADLANIGAIVLKIDPTAQSAGFDYSVGKIVYYGDCLCTITTVNPDSDGDGISDHCDQDDDNDGIPDCVEKGLDDIGNAFKINGNAVRTSVTDATLTTNIKDQSGQMWSYGKVDFSKSFTLSYQAYFGTDDNGADGIATVFQNSPAGINAVGGNGSGIGAKGIANGIVLELDTYYNGNDFGGNVVGDVTADHGMIWDSDNQQGAGLLSTAIALPNLEDGNYHNVIITWNQSTQNISYTVDGLLVGSFTGDLVNNYFGGASKVYFGYTASTGGNFNLQKIRIADFCNDLPLILDTDNDGIPNHLDLDSDNDGCLDAMEGDENVTNAQLITAGGTLNVGIGSSASNQNLCASGACVNSNGFPIVVNSGGVADIGADEGQGVGDSANALIISCFCYKPTTTLGTVLPTNQGITALGRAGVENGNWPMVRNGAWTALEAKTKGFVINRIANTAAVAAIPNPVEGMMVYDVQADCLKINIDGTSTGWKCFNTQTCP